MPRKRVNKSPPMERRSDDGDDEDFFFDDCQSNSSRGGQEPQQRNAANARERARMRVLSKAFCRLKTTLPWVPADTKLSKLDTLRLAASYIAHLRALLNDEPRPSSQRFSHPLNLAWPFAFQHGGTLNCLTPRWNCIPPEDLNHEDKTPEYNKSRNDLQQRRDFSHRDQFPDCQAHHVDEKRYHDNVHHVDEKRYHSNGAVVAGNYEQTVQYSSYDYRECYHEEIRNSY